MEQNVVRLGMFLGQGADMGAWSLEAPMNFEAWTWRFLKAEAYGNSLGTGVRELSSTCLAICQLAK